MEAPQPRPQAQVQGAGNPPLDFFSPMSIVVWLTVFSPIIISIVPNIVNDNIRIKAFVKYVKSAKLIRRLKPKITQ